MKKSFLMVLAMVMCSAMGFAQEKEYQVGEDGFEWYKVKKVVNGKQRVGAEDRYGNMIVPAEYVYIDYVDFWSRFFDDPALAGFHAAKQEGDAWYNKGGKCIVPYSRGYTYIHKTKGGNEFGTYYEFHKPDGCGILDKNGREVLFVKFNGSEIPGIRSIEKNGKNYYFIEFLIEKDGKKFYGCADANENIIVEPKYGMSDAISLAESRVTTTNNPLAGNGHETLAEAEARPQGGQNKPVAGQQQGGNHRDPVPMQQWQACMGCGGMGTMGCDHCGGSGTRYVGDRLRVCSRCNGQGVIPCNVCYGNKGQYITVYR